MRTFCNLYWGSCGGNEEGGANYDGISSVQLWWRIVRMKCQKMEEDYVVWGVCSGSMLGPFTSDIDFTGWFHWIRRLWWRHNFHHLIIISFPNIHHLHISQLFVVFSHYRNILLHDRITLMVLPVQWIVFIVMRMTSLKVVTLLAPTPQ